MALEGAGRRELAQLVADHVLGDVDRDELPAVVDGERVADHLRDHGGAPRPGLDDLLLVGAVHLLHLLEEVGVDERALLQRSTHDVSLAVYFLRRCTMNASLGLRPRVL